MNESNIHDYTTNSSSKLKYHDFVYVKKARINDMLNSSHYPVNNQNQN